jgi:hypothetical protein
MLCAGAAVVIGLSAFIRFARTAMYPASTAVAEQNQQKQIDQFRLDLDRYAAQINGRSLFFAPRESNAGDATTVVQPADHEPLKPTHYAGPSIIAMVNGTVWFSDGQRVEIGKDGRDLTVVSAEAPWSAKIRWQGVEFDVGLFERDTVVYKQSGERSGNWVAPRSPMGTPATPPAKPAVSSLAPPPAPVLPAAGNPPSLPPAPDRTPPLMPPPAPPPEPEPQPSPGSGSTPPPSPDQPAEPAPHPEPESSSKPEHR